MVEHGCTILASPAARQRELEAQTSIKRGYLNLLHAREAIARHAAAGGRSRRRRSEPSPPDAPASRRPAARPATVADHTM